MRRSRQVLVAGCGLALAAATSVPVFAQTQDTQTQGSAAAARTLPVKKIQADNFRFCKPSETTCSTTADTNHKTHVLVGQKIKWIYRDAACDSYYICPGHNVTFKSRHSGTVMQEGAVIYTTTFRKPGTYSYWCTHHQNQGMTGRIVVTTS